MLILNFFKKQNRPRVIRKTVDRIEYINGEEIILENPEEIMFNTGKWGSEEEYLDYWKSLETSSQEYFMYNKEGLIKLKKTPDNKYIVIQDGRHRAYVAKKHKLTNIPVHIINEDVYE